MASHLRLLAKQRWRVSVLQRWSTTSSQQGSQYRTHHSGRGSLVLGQEQDSLGGGFEYIQSFQGSLTNVNVWSYVLSASSIKSLSKSCHTGSGNVYKWSDFRDGIKGKTAIVIPSPCSPLSSRGWVIRGRNTVFKFWSWSVNVNL